MDIHTVISMKADPIWLLLVSSCLILVSQNVAGQDVIIDINLPGIMIIDEGTTTSNEGIKTTSGAISVETKGGSSVGNQASTQANTATVEDTSFIMNEETTIANTVTEQTSEDTTFIPTVQANETTTSADTVTEQTVINLVSGAITEVESVTTAVDNEPVTTKPTVVVVIPEIPFGGVPCEKLFHKGCNISNLERCVLIRERARRCICLTGYARDTDGRTCIAVEQYMVTLKIEEVFTQELNNANSNTYRQLEFDAINLLNDALQKSNLWAITKDTKVFRFRRADDGTVLITFKVEVSREYAPLESMVRKELIKGFTGSIEMGQNKVQTSNMLITMLEVSAPDPCSDRLLNHCDRTAKCQRGRRGFVCQCQQEDTDLSYNLLEAPGEICSVSPCLCENGGVCEQYNSGVSCRCPEWFLGSTCQIDGKAILIGLVCVLGVLVLLCIFLCTYCFAAGKMKRKHRFRRKTFTKSQRIMTRTQNVHYGVNYYPYNNYLSYPQLINYWQRPTTALYSPRYSNTPAIAWKWVENKEKD